MKLTIREGFSDDWYVIEPRMGGADVEGDASEMLAIAEAIEKRGRVIFKRCAVRVDGDKVYLSSPRNSVGEDSVSLAQADGLAGEIRALVKLSAPTGAAKPVAVDAKRSRTLLSDDDVAALNDQACDNNFGRQGEWSEMNEDGKAWARELANLAYERGRASTGSHMTDEQIAELFDNAIEEMPDEAFSAWRNILVDGELIYWEKLPVAARPHMLAFARAALQLNPAGDWQALAAAVKALPHGTPGGDNDGPAERFWAELGDVALESYAALKAAADYADEWRRAVETALGVEPDEAEHTPEWAHERLLALRESGNAQGEEASRLAAQVTRLRAIAEAAAGTLDGEGYAMTAIALRAQLQDVGGSIPAAVSTGARCDSGDGERGLVPSQVGRREELPPSVNLALCFCRKSPCECVPLPADEPLSDDYLGKARRRIDTMQGKTTEQRLHGLTMAVSYLLDHLRAAATKEEPTDGKA